MRRGRGDFKPFIKYFQKMAIYKKLLNTARCKILTQGVYGTIRVKNGKIGLKNVEF